MVLGQCLRLLITIQLGSELKGLTQQATAGEGHIARDGNAIAQIAKTQGSAGLRLNRKPCGQAGQRRSQRLIKTSTKGIPGPESPWCWS